MKTIDVGEASGTLSEYLKQARDGALGLHGARHSDSGDSDACQYGPGDGRSEHESRVHRLDRTISSACQTRGRALRGRDAPARSSRNPSAIQGQGVSSR